MTINAHVIECVQTDTRGRLLSSYWCNAGTLWEQR